MTIVLYIHVDQVKVMHGLSEQNLWQTNYSHESH